MLNETINKNIKDYISLRSDSKVASRGEILYNDNAANLISFSKAANKWVFTVQGTMIYEVIISKVATDNINTSCDCMYNWGGICKHVVAALLYISDPNRNSLGKLKNIKKAKVKTRDSKGLELVGYKNLTDDIILQNASNSLRNNYYFESFAEIQDMKIDKNRISFSMEYFPKNKNVIITLVGDKVYISEEKPIKKITLSHIEASCLFSISHSQTPNLLDIIFNNQEGVLESKILDKFGFSKDKNFAKFFYLQFCSERGLVVSKTKYAQGLITIDDKDTSFIDNAMSELDSEFEFKHTGEHIKEKRELGFYIEFVNPDYNYESDYDTPFLVLPIVGKSDKRNTTLSSHIKEYYEVKNKYTIDVSDNAKQVLDLAEEISECEDSKKSFTLIRSIMLALAKEAFVFVYNNEGNILRKSDLTPINVSPELFDVSFEVKSNGDFNIVEPKVILGDKVLSAQKVELKLNSSVAILDNNYYVANNFKNSRLLESLSEPVKMMKEHKALFFNNVIKPLAKYTKLKFTTDEFKVEKIELNLGKKQIFLSENKEFLIIKPQIEYQQGVSVSLHSTGDILEEKDDKLFQYIRNEESEQEFIDLIGDLHPDFALQKDDKLFYLHNNEFTSNMWFYSFFEALENNQVEVFGLKNLKNFKYSPYKGSVNTSIASGQDWFEVNIDVSFGDNKVKLRDIRKAIINKEKYVQLKDGSVGILPDEWFQKFEKYFRHGEISKEAINISKLKFSILDELFDNIDDTKVLAELAEKQRKLASFTHIEDTKVPDSITADLRPYQKEGLNWLNFLHEMGWGGILADDMGLGKTLQILTFLQHVLAIDKTTNLIVLPTSLLFNWENEIEKFSPNIKSFCHYGGSRNKDISNFESFDIVFTTYGVLMRDIEILKEFKFNYVILDESQAIKNPSSSRYKAASLLKSKNRLALSGTPIENSTFDLFAQMNFVNPGFLGGITSFKEKFSNAIDKNGDEEIAAELQTLINPFVLRRTKEKVAAELPSKTEGVIYCEMGAAQRQVYDAYRNKFRDRLLGNIEQSGIGRSKLMVLEGLMRLRQICDSPVLLNDEEINVTDSVKIKELIQHITDKTANHKILVFSQFTSMLGLIKTELNKKEIPFEYLDGKSNRIQRQKSVDKFQQDKNTRVFLISLKAGGTGLNLTAADYVYIIDPWWNPAVENQAIDRCYRIGQDKKVFAYKMICKNTIEEKILTLQNKKLKLANDIVSTDENIMKNLTIDDISSLFD